MLGKRASTAHSIAAVKQPISMARASGLRSPGFVARVEHTYWFVTAVMLTSKRFSDRTDNLASNGTWWLQSWPTRGKFQLSRRGYDVVGGHLRRLRLWHAGKRILAPSAGELLSSYDATTVRKENPQMVESFKMDIDISTPKQNFKRFLKNSPKSLGHDELWSFFIR